MPTSQTPSRPSRKPPPKKARRAKKPPAPLAPSERARRYAEGIAAGHIPAPDYLVLAAKRHADFIKSSYYSYHPENVDARCELIERLELPSGEVRRFELLGYQTLAMSFIYGFRDKDGHRAIHRLLTLVPRKSGKSSFYAGVCIGELVHPMGGGRNKVVLCAGVNDETAGHVFNKAVDMLLMEKEKPGGLVESRDLDVKREIIRCGANGGEMKKTTSGARTMDGWTADLISFDEISALKEPNAIYKLNSGLGHSPNRLLLLASTEGDLPDSALDTERELCINMLQSKKKQVSYVGLLYCASAEDDWTSQAVWEKVQPRLYTPGMLGIYKEECENAKNDERVRDNFLLRQLNIPVGGGIAWLNSTEYDVIPRLEPDEVWPIPEPQAYKHYIGIDLGDTRDASVICLLSVKDDDLWEARFWVFYPDGKGIWVDDGDYTIKAIYSGGVHKKYRRLAEKGHATICSGPVVNHSVIAEKIKDIHGELKLQGLYSDPWHGLEELRMALPEDIQGRLIPIPKNVGNMSPAVRDAEAKIRWRKLKVQENKIVRDHFLNAVAHHYEFGGVMLKKVSKTSFAHIDAADAFMHAVAGRSYVNSKESFVGTEMRPIDNDEGDDAEPYVLDE